LATDTYLKLRADIADTVNRDDLSADVTAFEGTTIDSQIKRAVQKATTTIQRDLVSRGGHKNMETVTTSLTFTAGVEYLDFPTDFAGHRSFIITSDPLRVLEFVDPVTLRTQYANAATNKPEKFTIIGTRRAYARPIADSAYTTELIYYAALTALSADSDTNWVLTYHPDIYIAAAMIELSIFLENDQRLQFWKGKYDQSMNDLMGDDRNVRWAGVPQMPNLQVAIA
jgi:hypothetical protein